VITREEWVDVVSLATHATEATKAAELYVSSVLLAFRLATFRQP
jgi:hypothetical protein